MLTLATAPEDGTIVLLGSKTCRRAVEAFWATVPGGGAWEDFNYKKIEFAPTHWQPVPEPPR